MNQSFARNVRLSAMFFTGLPAIGIAAPSPALACTLCSCTATATNIAFGTYDPTSSAPSDTSGTVTVNCTGLVSLFGSVDIASSAGSSGNAAQRTLRQGTNTLNYNLYVNAARTIVFGDGSAGTQTITTPLNGLLIFGQSAFIYGRMPARQWGGAGSYSDTVVITISY